jgi:hypothetical protein
MTAGTRFRVQELLQLFKDDTQHQFLVMLQMRRKLIAEVVTAWSLDLPVPGGDTDVVDKVPGSAYDVLKAEVEPHMDRLDFIQAASTSSESKTSSKATSSPAKGRAAKP